MSFKKFSGGDPGPLQREGATPSRTQHPARPLAGRVYPNLGPLQLFSRGCAPGPGSYLLRLTLKFLYNVI